MKTYEEIGEARNVIRSEIYRGGLSPEQKIMLQGLLLGLRWAAGDATPEDVITRMVEGERVERAKQ